MAKLMAYLCNDDSLTAVALQAIRPQVAFPETSASNGFGFGWIQDGRSLLRTHPKPPRGSADFVSLLADIPSRALLGHVRESDDEAGGALELQPFRFRRWVFAHDGESPELDAVKAELLADVPGFVRSNIKGIAGAEVLGHVFLAELHRRDLLEKGRTNPRGCAEALFQTMQNIQSLAAIGDFAAVGVTERAIVAGRLHRPLYYRVVRGLSVREPPLFAGHKPKSVNHPTFKAVLVTDAVADPSADGWHIVPDRSVLYVDGDWNVQFFEA